MPKIIENVRQQLLTEAKRQITEVGYKSTTIRSVATACKVAVGTVYNYFKSKDILIASFILEDWLLCLSSIGEYPKEDKKDYLSFIHSSLNGFVGKYTKLFSDRDAAQVFGIAFSERHRQLRAQLAELIRPITDGDFSAEYIAESMLTWTMAGRSFAEIYPLLPEQIK